LLLPSVGNFFGIGSLPFPAMKKLTPLEVRAMQPLVAKPDPTPPPKISRSLGTGQSENPVASKSKKPGTSAPKTHGHELEIP
jgi:hypothetical protein